ncbi:MAG: hypothetical protein ACUVUP_02850 [Thermaceae bacterium]
MLLLTSVTAQLCAVTALATGNRVLAGPSGIGSAARIFSASRRAGRNPVPPPWPIWTF